MIPMRDGIRLHTTIYSPIDSTVAYPILMKRTPYSSQPYGENAFPSSLGPSNHFVDSSYIFVVQDVRGRYMSEGEFVQVTPHLPQKAAKEEIDESTDTYDTIEWLLANVQNHNGRVGMYGISYPGFYCSAGMIDAHPALRAVSPQAPVADWYFDDFIHPQKPPCSKPAATGGESSINGRPPRRSKCDFTLALMGYLRRHRPVMTIRKTVLTSTSAIQTIPYHSLKKLHLA